MQRNWVKYRFGDLVIFDKKFKGLGTEQTKTVSFPHVSAENLKMLKRERGSVKLLSTGQFDGVTTEELAGNNLANGEVISIPSGGNACLKYYKGTFVDSGNILCCPLNDSVNLKFVYYSLLNKQREINSMYRGASIKHPQMKEIYCLPLYMPEYDVQTSIVKELNRISELIEIKKMQLAEYDKLTLSIFYEKFGDPITNEKKWNVKKLDSLCELSQGLAINRQTKHYLSNSRTNIPLLRIKDMKEGTREIFVKEDDCPTSCLAYPEDIIYTRTGTLGLAFTNMYGIMHNNCFKIKICDELNKFFFMYYIQGDWFKNNVVIQASRSSQPDITHKLFLSQSIIVPPIPQQESFAKQLELIQAQKNIINDTIKDLESLQAARMQYYFE